MPQTTGGAGGQDEPKKKKRVAPGPPDRTGRPSPEVPEPTIPSVRTMDTMAGRLSFLDNHKVFPTDVTWSLGNSPLNNNDVAKAAKFFARKFDLSVGDYFNPYSFQGDAARNTGISLAKYRDPYLGGPLSLPSARRLLEAVEPTIIENWLQGQNQGLIATVGQPARTGQSREQWASQVQETFKPGLEALFGRKFGDITISFGEDLQEGAVAQTGASPVPGGPSQILLGSKWFDEHPNDAGAVVHEMVHALMSGSKYQGKENGWFQEALADYGRDRMGLTTKWSKPHPGKLRQGYQTGAHFLLQVESVYHGAVKKAVALVADEGIAPTDALAQVTGHDTFAELRKLVSPLAVNQDLIGKVNNPEGVSSKTIISTLNTLTPLVGDQLNFGEALAVAKSMSTAKMSKAFKQNATVLVQGAMANDPKLAIATAAEAAARGVTLNDFYDVTAFLTGSKRETIVGAVGFTRAQDTIGMPVNNLTPITATTGTEVIKSSVGELHVLSDLYNAIKDRDTSYSEAAAQIMAEAHNPIDDRSIGEKFATRTLGFLDVLNRPLDAALRLMDPDVVFAPYQQVGVDDNGDPINAWRLGFADARDILVGDASLYDNQRMKDLGWDTGEIIFWEMAMSIGIPAGASAKAFAETSSLRELGQISRGVSVGRKIESGLLYTGEFILDPLATAGKTAKVIKGRRFLPMLGSTEEVGLKVTQALTEPQRALGGLDVPAYIDEAIGATENGNELFRRVVHQFRTNWGTDALHPITAQAIWDWGRRARSLDMPAELRQRGIRNFITESLGVPVKDPLADEIRAVAYGIEQDNIAQALKAGDLPTAVVRGEVAQRNAQVLIDQMDEFSQEIFLRGPLMHEIPTIGRLKGQVFKGEGALAKMYRAGTLRELPLREGNYYNFLPDTDVAKAVDNFESVAISSRVFSKDEIASWRTEFSRASRSTNVRREGDMAGVLTKFENTMLKRLGDQLGATPSELEDFSSQVFSGRTWFSPGENKQMFNPTGTVEQARTPQMPSQLKNEFQVIDPVRVRKAYKEMVGYTREADSIVRRVLGKDASKVLGTRKMLEAEVANLASELKAVRKAKGDDTILAANLRVAKQNLASLKPRKAATVTPSHATGIFSRNVYRPLMGLVKAGWVFRPAYVPRITGEEYARTMSTIGFMNRWRAGGKTAPLLASLKMSDDKIVELADRLNISFDDAQKLYYPGLLPTDPQSGQGAIHFIANAEGDRLPPDVERGLAREWTDISLPVKPGGVEDKRFLQSWERALFQFQQDEFGQEILKVRAEGMKSEDAIQHMEHWLRSDETGRRVAARMDQVDGWNIEDAARLQTDYLYRMTPHPEMAEAVAKGGMTLDALGNVDRELWPSIVHGPAMGGMRTVKNEVKEFGQAAARIIGEVPTNTLIRHPYANHFYSTMYQHLREQALAAGKTLDDGLDARLQNEARRFAREQTQKVMFDFTRQGRLSEAAWWVAPFLQPFMEVFQVWPKIVKNNPAIAAYTIRAAQAAHESGLFQTVPQSGEPIISANGVLFPMSTVANVITGGKRLAGFSTTMNVAGLSMFSTSTYPFHIPGFGDVSVPTPALSPGVQAGLQWLIQRNPGDLMSEREQLKNLAWITEFGEVDFTKPADWILPTWGRHFLTAVVPSWFETETNKNTNRMLAVLQAVALEDGQTDWRVNDETRAVAHHMAVQFSFMKALASAFYPASPRWYTPTSEHEAEWSATIDANDGDIGKAWDQFVGVFNPETGRFEGGTHPGETLVATGKTFWTDEENPFPMPANKAAQEILMSEGGQQFVKEFPELALFIIPQEIRDGEVDLGVLNSQIAEGQRAWRTPSQFAESADVTAGWSAAFALRDQFDVWKNRYPDLEAGDNAYDIRKAQYDADVQAIGEFFPEWGAQYANKFMLETGVDPNVEQTSRAVIQSEEFRTKTDLGKGLAWYYTGKPGIVLAPGGDLPLHETRNVGDSRDKIERDMAAANVTNLDTVVAEEMGFKKRYDTLVSEISAAHPDFERWYRYAGLDKDLQHVKTEGEKARDKAIAGAPAAGESLMTGVTPEGMPERTGVQSFLDTLANWEQRWEVLKSAPYDENKITTNDEKFAAYDKMRAYADQAYQFPPSRNPLKLWWGVQNPKERQDYITGVAGRDSLYWSRFDWEVMGLKTTAKTAETWTQIKEARDEAWSKYYSDPNFEIGPALDAIDKGIANYAKTNKAFRAQVEVANNWAYGLRVLVLKGLPGKDPTTSLKGIATSATRSDWADVLNASDTIRDFAINIHPGRDSAFQPSDPDPDVRVGMAKIRDSLEKYIQQKRKDSPAFDRQYAYVSSLYTPDTLVDILFPTDSSSYYPIGQVG